MTYIVAVILIVVVVALVVLLLRVVTGGRLRTPGGRARQSRLAIVDAFDLDRQRQLVIVRRDNVEHLLMIGGPNDLVVEASILRTPAAELAGRQSMTAPTMTAPTMTAPTMPPPAPPVPGPSAAPETLRSPEPPRMPEPPRPEPQLQAAIQPSPPAPQPGPPPLPFRRPASGFVPGRSGPPPLPPLPDMPPPPPPRAEESPAGHEAAAGPAPFVAPVPAPPEPRPPFPKKPLPRPFPSLRPTGAVAPGRSEPPPPRIDPPVTGLPGPAASKAPPPPGAPDVDIGPLESLEDDLAKLLGRPKT